MAPRLSYGQTLAATLLGGAIAAIVMIVPSWLWARYVLDVSYDAIVGRGEGLEHVERGFLYGGNIVFALLGYLVYAWIVGKLVRAFDRVDLLIWDTFAALILTGIAAALVAHAFPFVGLLIVVFAAPAFVNAVAVRPIVAGHVAREAYAPQTRHIAPPVG
jgi:hypothetical protein